MARPKLDIDPVQVRTLASEGHSVVDIATTLGCSRELIHLRFSTELTLGRTDHRINLRKKLNKATDASVPVLLARARRYLDIGDKSLDEMILDALAESGLDQEDLLDLIKNKDVVEKLKPKRSFNEFVMKAGYPEPYEKQVEMKDFVIKGGPKNLKSPRLLLGARTYGKTVFSTIAGVAYEIYIDPSFTVLLTTKVEKNGRRILKEISRCLKANGVPLGVDNADEIRVAGLVGKESSVIMVPLGSSGFRSLHPKLCIMDDPVVPGNVSEADREQVRMVYEEVLKLTKNVAIIGQPVDFRDLYQYLRSIIETMEVPYGSIPELDEDLEIFRASGVDEKSIQASYFLKVDPEGDATFHDIQMIEAFPETDAFAFLDPAEGGDTTALGIFTGYFQGMAIQGFAWKKAWHLCVPQIKEACVKYRIKKLIFETNMFGVLPLQVLRENLDEVGVSVIGKYTTSNKEARIQLAAQFSKSLYLCKTSDAEYRRQVIEYSHDAKNDDAPDTIASFLEITGRIRPPRAIKDPADL